eukprot:365533-Chlamydomonas_euryale.AAC.4
MSFGRSRNFLPPRTGFCWPTQWQKLVADTRYKAWRRANLWTHTCNSLLCSLAEAASSVLQGAFKGRIQTLKEASTLCR